MILSEIDHICEVCGVEAVDHDNDRWPVPACCPGCPCGVEQ